MATYWQRLSSDATRINPTRSATRTDEEWAYYILLHKGGQTDEHKNYLPITLLNASYKILAKALQRRLQPFLPELIDEDQTAFLPMRYILDNVLVQTEAIQWCKESQ